MTGKLLIDWQTSRQTPESHRQLLLVTGAVDWCHQHISSLLESSKHKCLILSDSPVDLALKSIISEPAHFTTVCKISQYKQHLGEEFGLVIYNAFDGVKPSALYAIEGTIQRSGLLVILAPDLSHWPSYEASKRGIAFSHHSLHTQSLFLQRMIALLSREHTLAKFSQRNSQLPLAQLHSTPSTVHVTPQQSQGKSHKQPLTSEQQGAFFQLLEQCNNPSSVGLIIAKRGRGKSTLLGHLAAALITQTELSTIYITAPHQNNARTARLTFERIVQSNTKKAKLKYIAPDQIESMPANTVLLIDEAAAIAPAIVLFACRTFPHTILATTVAGYEGSGLGFNLRVLPQLKNAKPKFTSVELISPLRWYDDDPLEQLFSDIFAPFSDTEISEQAAVALHSSNQMLTPLVESGFSHKPLHIIDNLKQRSVFCHELDKSIFLSNEWLLAKVFGLLLQSHYQTNPDDLMRLLDAEDHHIFILSDSNEALATNSTLLAVAVVVHEGKIDTQSNTDLLDGISNASRRVNGHLVCQNLSSTYADTWFMQAKSWRISRIAVLPSERRSGLGQLLVNKLIALARDDSVDFISTSFGLTTELTAFWESLNFALIKVGARRDTSSGEHSGIMVFCISDKSNNTFDLLLSVANNDMQYLLAGMSQSNLAESNRSLQSYGENIAMRHAALIRASNAPYIQRLKAATRLIHDRRIAQFLHAQRSFLNAAASIYYLINTNRNNTTTESTLASAFDKAQQRHIDKVSKITNLQVLKSELQKKSSD